VAGGWVAAAALLRRPRFGAATAVGLAAVLVAAPAASLRLGFVADTLTPAVSMAVALAAATAIPRLLGDDLTGDLPGRRGEPGGVAEAEP
jgi:hypothetical protein